MELVLRLPTPDEEEEFLRAHHASSPGVPNFLHGYDEGMPFGRYLELLAGQTRGEHLPPGHVASTFLFAFAGVRIVGRVSIRHELNPYLERFGGHIGYVVVPEFRRRGIATEMLRQALVIAREEFGLVRVLVTCDDDNIGSIRTIEKNGGVLEGVVADPEMTMPKRRYWIETADVGRVAGGPGKDSRAGHKRLRQWRRGLMAALMASGAMPLLAQTWPFPWPEDRIAEYTARRATSPIVIDGRLNEADWRAVERSPRFADLIGGQPGIHDTRAAVLWDDTFLYVGYWIEEPFVEATLTERDSPIYKNNDVELFIAGRDAYYEFEINSFGTIYEVLFIWEQAFESAGYARRPEFDRTRDGVRQFAGVGFKNHPRGRRIGYWNWDMPGLATAVHVDGTINDNRDRDRGWTVELRIPWQSLEPLAMPDGRALPPRDGDVWRMDFSRFNQYKEAPPATDPGGWAWSPHGVWDSHVPELFTRVRFSIQAVSPVRGGR